MASARTIGNISNYDQLLFVKKENGRFWWIICSNAIPGTESWQEIPEYLFTALNSFEEN